MKASVVTVVGESKGEKRLLAYVLPVEDSSLTISDLADFLRGKLPEYMVPSAYLMLEELPLTPNGKVDRKALPEPPGVGMELPGEPEDETTLPTTRIGQLVASILSLEDLDSNVNLLNLGATSVDMIRIANLLDKELSFRPKMDELYRLPTVIEIAKSYQQHERKNKKPTERMKQIMEPIPRSVLTSYELLLDPQDREMFKNKEPGVRWEDDKSFMQLITSDSDELLKKTFIRRQSHRHFIEQSIPLSQLSQLFSCLRQISIEGNPKYLYPSAGSLYPVQTYLYVKPGRVEGLTVGIYYYQPIDHRLVLLSADVDLDRNIYDLLINRPIFDEAAFSIFLITQLSAIAPIYGELARDFSMLEAGCMLQQLMMSAPTCQLGVCPECHSDKAHVDA